MPDVFADDAASAGELCAADQFVLLALQHQLLVSHCKAADYEKCQSTLHDGNALRGPKARPETFDEGHFELLKDPGRPVPAGHCVQFGQQFASARIVAAKRQDDQTEHCTGCRPEH